MSDITSARFAYTFGPVPVDKKSITPRGRALAAALRAVRERAGVSGRDLGSRLGLSHSVISHWETGRRVPTSEDVASVLTALRVTGPEKDDLINLSRHAAQPNWFNNGSGTRSRRLAAVIESERSASRIFEWSPGVVPGLLQTTAYTRAMAITGGQSEADAEKGAQVRYDRKVILVSRRPVDLHVMIGEPALRDNLGGHDVMADQLRHLVEISDRPNITVQVMPLGVGWHPGVVGSFVLYDFPDTPAVLYFEHFRSGAFDPDADDVRAYRRAIDTMSRLAMSPQSSLRFLTTLAEDLV